MSNPRYPVYIPSKGRWESRLTMKAFDRIGVPYHVVIEPQEYDGYAAVIDPEKILTLPFSNLGQGSIPARNWIWNHSRDNGFARHWQFDDNIESFWRLNHNLRVKVADGTIFNCVEDFVERYENVPHAGLQYFMFCADRTAWPAFYLNTRVYSMHLLCNETKINGEPLDWRGRYNEDTDLSLRILKAGYCTMLFNAFLGMKATTMTMKGGNMDELYKDDGRLKMAEALRDAHPDVCTITRKWGRWQHQVNYKPFRKNKLIKKSGLEIKPGINNYGMRLVKI